MKAKRLRTGYTTGTCAAAAAKAAALLLLTGEEPASVSLVLPPGEVCHLPVEVCSRTEEGAVFSSDVSGLQIPAPGCRSAAFRVKKDAGDDPDVTNAVWVYGRVSLISKSAHSTCKTGGKGYFLSEYPFLYVDGGEGIGMATKPGLSCPVGHFAINPVPRQMITSAVEDVRRKAAAEEFLLIETAIPQGRQLAARTFNPRLGIIGGISILGTTGMVKPMSEEALLETIRLEIHMRRTAQAPVLLVSPGNYGEAFLKDEKGIALGSAVLCSNFVWDTARMARAEGLSRVLFAGHIGKLIKVSAGVKNTHSQYGDGRMEQLARLTKACGGSEMLCGQVLAANTTDEAAGILKETGLAAAVFALTAEKIREVWMAWTDGAAAPEVIVFSSVQNVCAQTPGAELYVEIWKTWAGCSI